MSAQNLQTGASTKGKPKNETRWRLHLKRMEFQLQFWLFKCPPWGGHSDLKGYYFPLEDTFNIAGFSPSQRATELEIHSSIESSQIRYNLNTSTTLDIWRVPEDQGLFYIQFLAKFSHHPTTWLGILEVTIPKFAGGNLTVVLLSQYRITLLFFHLSHWKNLV